MSLDFGKLNFSVSLNPTSAFPLDARYYFESLSAAQAAAASAEAAGSTNTVYYYGQSVVVVENDVASFYIIQPDGTLGAISGQVAINSNLFEYDENGNLNLIGFSDAVAGAQLVKGANGTASWVKPDSTTVEGLSTAVETLRSDVDKLTENVYTKAEVDTKIAAAGHLKRKIVEKYEDIQEYIDTYDDEESYIFMVPVGVTDYDNKYNEYIVVDGIIEPVGDWSVDLSDYATTAEVEEALKKKVDAVEGSRLITSEEAEKLKGIEEGAQKNYITSVEEAQFEVVEGKLKLIAVQQEIITGLTDALKNKVDVVEGKGLSSNDFTDELKTKLESIQVQDLNAALSKVETLDKDVYGYINEETGEEVPGLIDLVPILQTDLGDLQTVVSQQGQKITTLESTVGTLSNDVNDLKTTISSLGSTYVTIENFDAVVGDLDTMLADQINVMNEINDINSRLTWQDIQ